MVTKDQEHLQLLSIFHFVVAGMTALFALFPIFHLVIGLVIVSGALPETEGEEFPVFIGWILVLIASVFIVCGLTLAGLIALAGQALRRRRHYTFCLVIAALSCLIMPFGTVLGVFTIVVLMRDPVKSMFGRPVPDAGAGQP